MNNSNVEMNVLQVMNKYHLENQSWTQKGFHSVLHTFFPVGEEQILPLKKHFGIGHTMTIFFLKDNYLHWYWNDASMETIRNEFIKKVQANPKYLTNWLSLWKRLLKKFIVAYKKCDCDFSLLSDTSLLALYKQFYDAYIDQYSIAVGIQDPFSLHADRFFIPKIHAVLVKKGRVQELQEIFATLTNPVTESFVALEYKDRLALLQRMKKDKNDSRIPALLEKHSKKWFWVENNYAVQRVLEPAYFAQKIEQELKLGIDPQLELKKIERRVPENKKRKTKLIKELGLNNDIQHLISIAEVFTYMQDERKKYVLISNHYQRLFCEEIGKRVGLTWDEMAYTVYPEMEAILLHKTFDRKKLAERKKQCVCIQTEQGYEILEGPLAERLHQKIFFPKEFEHQVKGMCASQGKAQGIVKIIQKVHDLVNVYQGDILVTSMTRPEMVVAMEKAAAIVTDEGGITSHAAIVSRELGVPCIIGTKNATTILKNGDLVEVDATKGIVRKLK